MIIGETENNIHGGELMIDEYEEVYLRLASGLSVRWFDGSKRGLQPRPKQSFDFVVCPSSRCFSNPGNDVGGRNLDLK